jgi:lantibiotic modifying enzyme
MIKENYINKITEIANIIKDVHNPKIGLLDGQIGIILFELYYAKLLQDKKLLKCAIQSIEKTYSSFENIESDPSLSICSGIAGFGWFLNHIDKHQLLSNEISNKALNILRYAANYRRDITKAHVCDAGICHGSAGIGHIFYRMFRNTAIVDFKEAAYHSI